MYALSWYYKLFPAPCGSTVIDAKLIRIDLEPNVYKSSRLRLGTVTLAGIS